MMCPHCGHEINPGVNGADDPTPIYVNLNNNGCNPAPIVTVIPNSTCAQTFNPTWQPIINPACNAAAGCNPVMATFIKL